MPDKRTCSVRYTSMKENPGEEPSSIAWLHCQPGKLEATKRAEILQLQRQQSCWQQLVSQLS